MMTTFQKIRFHEIALEQKKGQLLFTSPARTYSRSVDQIKTASVIENELHTENKIYGKQNFDQK